PLPLASRLYEICQTLCTLDTGASRLHLLLLRPQLFKANSKIQSVNVTKFCLPTVNGTTGESPSLSVAERKALAEEWCGKARGRMDQVVVHVGAMSLRDSQDLARHAAQIGADGIAVIAPFFFKPKTADALRKFLQEVASAASALPFYYYQIPAITGINSQWLVEGIEQLIPSFRGVKFSGMDLMDLGQCVMHSQPQWSILYGVDEVSLNCTIAGDEPLSANFLTSVSSCSTFNYLGSHVNKLLSAFETGDLIQARALQVLPMRLLLVASFDVGVNKQLMMEVSGLHLGPPRLPLMPCPLERSEKILQKYRSLFP
uniref:N-acetylneuraminate lyase n=1 Tax=Oryzias sinensis TaxID=183150 RepID=A0A8C8A6Q2_9TELE